jgi:hypothetical protein
MGKALYESPSSEELAFSLEGNFVNTTLEPPTTDPGGEGEWDEP